MKFIYLFIIIANTYIFGSSIDTVTKQSQTKHFIPSKTNDSIQIGYLLYLPANYSAKGEKAPLLLFLHGGGERGNDPDKLRTHGLPLLIEKGKQLPFVVVSPQCPANQFWNLDDLNEVLLSVIKNFNIDTNQIYATGLSMGGIGVWALSMKYPYRFAAIAPLCGSGDTSKASLLKSLPIWVFHGVKDMMVPIARSEELVNVIERVGGNVKFTKYPDLAHSIWRETYNNPQLYDWFLSNKKK